MLVPFGKEDVSEAYNTYVCIFYGVYQEALLCNYPTKNLVEHIRRVGTGYQIPS